MFADLLRSMAAADLLSQGADGLLLPGTRGDRLINHYTFYAVFHTPEELRVVDGSTHARHPAGRTSHPRRQPHHLRWAAMASPRRRPREEADPAHPVIRGQASALHRGALQVADTVRKRMRAIYRNDHRPPFLDDAALTLLQQGRDAYTRLHLNDVALIQQGCETVVLPWRGDTVMNTLAVLLQSRGLDVGHEGVSLTVAATIPAELQTLFRELATSQPPDPVETRRPQVRPVPRP